MSYLTNICYDTSENENFRTVLYTGKHSQLVVMSIPSEGEIGMERHDSVEQTLFILSGTGVAILNGDRKDLHPGDALVVTPGIEHDVLNTGAVPLKIFTVYSPPNHLDGRVHATKADADRDKEDEAFGEEAGGILNERILAGSFAEARYEPTFTSNGVVPGYFPDVEARPEPENPLENPEEPAISVHDEFFPSTHA